MATLLTSFKSSVLNHLLDLLWSQWSSLGLAGQSKQSIQKILDPEPLLLLSLTVCRYDARLFDEILDWLMVNGAFINVQRLKNLTTQCDFQCKAQLSAVTEVLGQKSSQALKWKNLVSLHTLKEPEPLFYMKDGKALPLSGEVAPEFKAHGLLRSPIKLRGYSQPFPTNGTPSLLLRLRALLGVNARSEILCLLGSTEEIHPSDIARQTGYIARTVQNALAEMARSGVVQMRICNREKKYWLQPGILDELLRPDGEFTAWINWSPLFRALELLWLGLVDPRRENLEPLLLASEFRRLAIDMRPLLGESGLAMTLRNENSYLGEEYAKIFIQDILALLERLKEY